MAIDPKLVQQLRAMTGAGIMDCKKALEKTGGDLEQAVKELAASGLAKVEKAAAREATVGWIGSYVHNNGKVGALVELGCNTDFVAKNEEFQWLLKELAIGVVAFNPKYVGREQVPAGLLDEEKKKYEADVKGKPPQIAEKILEGKLDKNFFSTMCLMSMPYPKEDVFQGTYGDLVKSKIARLGENIVLRRFVRLELGL
jgi:elongation factor Ts